MTNDKRTNFDGTLEGGMGKGPLTNDGITILVIDQFLLNAAELRARTRGADPDEAKELEDAADKFSGWAADMVARLGGPDGDELVPSSFRR